MKNIILDFFYKYFLEVATNLYSTQFILISNILFFIALFLYIFNISYFFMSGKNYFREKNIIFRLNNMASFFMILTFFLNLKISAPQVILLQFMTSFSAILLSTLIALKK